MVEPTNSFEAVYSRLTDESLILIAHGSTDDYRSEAVAVARKELDCRDIPPQEREALIASASRRRIVEAQPLSLGWKIVCALLAGLPALLISAFMMSKGRNRSAWDAVSWFAIGYALRQVLFVGPSLL